MVDALGRHTLHFGALALVARNRVCQRHRILPWSCLVKMLTAKLALFSCETMSQCWCSRGEAFRSRHSHLIPTPPAMSKLFSFKLATCARHVSNFNRQRSMPNF